MPSWLFLAPPPYAAYDRWWFVIDGAERRTHGPFPSLDRARDAREALFRRWAARAASLRGDVVRLRDRRWVVSLPRGHPCAGRPFEGDVVANHTASLEPERPSEGTPS